MHPFIEMQHFFEIDRAEGWEDFVRKAENAHWLPDRFEHYYTLLASAIPTTEVPNTDPGSRLWRWDRIRVDLEPGPK